MQPLQTHWTRSLYHDFVSDDAGSASPASERLVLAANDGYPITALRYPAAGAPRGHVVVAGAVGVPQRFYRRFAEFAASVGYSTMTLDYRGVGLSAPATLEGFHMDYFDWSRRDLAAAVAAMSTPEVPLYVVGHSFGGHAFGLLPNHEQVTAFYTFGTGAGWHGWMPAFERIKVLAMWHVVGPLLTRWKGYLSWSLLRLGEDVPLDFYRRWKEWCRYPNYFFGDPAMRHLLRSFARIRAPLMAVNSTDDRWAPPKSRDAFIAGYANAARQTLDIDPWRIGLRRIGHLGYFRAEALPLWKSALGWLDRRRYRSWTVSRAGTSTRRDAQRERSAESAGHRA